MNSLVFSPFAFVMLASRMLRRAVLECSAACSVARAFGLRRLDAAFPFAAGQPLKVTADPSMSRSDSSPLDAFRSLIVRPPQSQSGVKPPQSKASRHSRAGFGKSAIRNPQSEIA